MNCDNQDSIDLSCLVLIGEKILRMGLKFPIYSSWAKAKLGYRSLTEVSSPLQETIIYHCWKANVIAEVVMHLGDDMRHKQIK